MVHDKKKRKESVQTGSFRMDHHNDESVAQIVNELSADRVTTINNFLRAHDSPFIERMLKNSNGCLVRHFRPNQDQIQRN